MSTAIGRDRVLALHSAEEMVAAAGLAGAPSAVRAVARWGFATASIPLGRLLARFDARISEAGLSRAASMALADLDATWCVHGEPPPRGPVLVAANHPGAYDALALLAALGRDDIAILAADRSFLRHLPALARHLLFVPDAPGGSVRNRASGLLRAMRHIQGGGAVLQFAAGRIEPDPAFARPAGKDFLAPWCSGTGALVRSAAAADGVVSAAIVAGVHSRRAKGLWLTKLAERHGWTTLAPLLQVAVARYRHVDATVTLGPPARARDLAQGGDDAVIAARVRDRARELLPRTPRD